MAGHVPAADRAMEWTAQYAIFAVAVLVAASWFVRAGNGGEHRLAVYTAVLAAAISLALVTVIQHFYVHQRPFVVRNDVHLLVRGNADPSFPSEHTTAAFAMASGIVAYRRRLGALLVVIAVVTGFSRIFVGVHFPADVAAGAAIGALAALTLWHARPLLAWFDERVVVRIVPAPILDLSR
ncbi:MAG: phosphatase PAP2 family protein [Chloroflexi bacterium]|nr:phosphatase PAP2 family protein [Chloroflexota bacterium]